MAQEDLHERFRRNVRWFRKARQLTQSALAERMGVSPPYVSQVESGKMDPSLSVVARFADALGVTSVQLLGEAVEENLATPA